MSWRTFLEYSINNDGAQRNVNLSGRLSFDDHSVFREITAALKEDGPNKCSINVGGLEFIDSAGLGLLLVVNEAAKDRNISVTITGARDQVNKMLEITKFNEVVPVV
jgi:anti-anti-sigma factor